MDTIMQDLRFALRTLARTPGFVLVTLLTLALGIGANLAIFTVVNAVLLRPLSFKEPDRVVRIFDDLTGSGARNVGMSIPEMQDIEKSGIFDRVSAIFPASTALGGGDQLERIELLATSPNYFELLGVKPALGTTYTQADWAPGFLDGVVISDGLWRRQFAADPHVVGRRIRVDEDPYTILGVMPPGFRHPGPTVNGDVDLWGASGYVAAPFPVPAIRGARFLPGAIGRLKPGLSIASAQQRIDAIVATLTASYPDYPKQVGWKVRLEPVQASLTGNVRPTLFILLAAVTFVLLIVCVNVASLLLARSSARSREFAIRHAIGASGARLARQVLTECLLLSVAGGILALGVLRIGSAWLVSLIPPDIPRVAEIHADWTVALAALALSILTGFLFGVTPALQAARIDLTVGLKDGGGSSAGHSRAQRRSKSALVVAEVALSIMLLIGAGLLVRSFVEAVGANPGLDPHGLIAAQIWVPVPNNPQANRYLAQPARSELVHQLLVRLAKIPATTAIALGTGNDLPARNSGTNPAPFSLPDEATTQEQNHAAQFGIVSAQYFAALETPIKSGRAFTDHDDSLATPVVIVNQAFVRRFSPNHDPLGRIVRVGRAPRTLDLTIVGVAGDIHGDRLDLPPEPHVYFSMLQRPTTNLAVLMRTQLDVKAARAQVTRAVRDVDAELPVFGVRTVTEMMSSSIARRRFSLVLMSAFALSALVLAGLGIYGVVAFAVTQRTQEFGVRAALGASPSQILRVAVRPGLALAGVGAVVGIAGSFAATRLMTALLYGVSASDPVTFVTVPSVLLLVAAVACLIPGRRATKVSPVKALRT